jgi:uncharacterized protein YoxC
MRSTNRIALAHLAVAVSLALAGTALLVVMTVGMWKLGLKVDSTIDHVNELITDTQKRMDGTFQNTNAVLIQAGLAADQVRLTATTERSYIAGISRETLIAVKTANASLEDLDGMIKDTRQIATGVSTETLPKINLAVGGVTALLDTSKGVILEAGPAIDGASAVMADLHSILDAPAMHEIGPNLASTTKHLAGTSAEFEETVGYIRDDFKPSKKNFWHNLTSQIIPELLRFLIPTPVKISKSPL